MPLIPYKAYITANTESNPDDVDHLPDSSLMRTTTNYKIIRLYQDPETILCVGSLNLNLYNRHIADTNPSSGLNCRKAQIYLTGAS